MRSIVFVHERRPMFWTAESHYKATRSRSQDVCIIWLNWSLTQSSGKNNFQVFNTHDIFHAWPGPPSVMLYAQCSEFPQRATQSEQETAWAAVVAFHWCRWKNCKWNHFTASVVIRASDQQVCGEKSLDVLKHRNKAERRKLRSKQCYTKSKRMNKSKNSITPQCLIKLHG